MSNVLVIAVQGEMEVEDKQVIAVGYTFERKLVEIYFDDGDIVRRVEGKEEWRSDTFQSGMFYQNIKRWYRNGTHPYLIRNFEMFSEYGLSLTEGGPDWNTNFVS